MPTLGNIQRQIAMYLKKSLVDFDVTGDAGQNLVLTALNNARRHAEKLHDFSVCRQRGYFSFTNKTAWDSPTWYDGGTEKLRKGKLWDLRTEGAISSEFGGTNIPLKMVRSDTKHQLESRRAYDAAVSDFERRALPDSTLLFDHPFLNQVYIMTRGKWLEYYPYSTEVKNIMVDGYRWWPDWTVEDSSVWNGVLPTSIYGSYVDNSYVEIRVRNALKADVGAIALDVANDGNIVSSLPLPYGTRNTPVVGLQSSNITKEFVCSIFRDFLGFDAELTTTSVKISFPGEPNLESVVRLYNHNIGDYAVNESITFTQGDIITSTTTDWWTENASEYLLWRALVECNHLGHVFTANREANLPSPDKKADTALALLIQNDQDAENPGEIQQY